MSKPTHLLLVNKELLFDGKLKGAGFMDPEKNPQPSSASPSPCNPGGKAAWRVLMVG